MVLTNVLRPNKQVTAGFSDGGFFVDFVYLLDYTVNVAGAPPPPPFRFSLFGAKKSSQKKRRPDRLFVSGFSELRNLPFGRFAPRMGFGQSSLTSPKNPQLMAA